MSTPPAASVWAVYTTESEPFELARLDAATGARTAVVQLGGAMPDDTKHIALGFNSAWVASGHQIVHRVDLATATVTARIELSHHLEGVTVAANSVWISSDQSGGRLIRIDPRTNTAGPAVVSPAYPRELAGADGGLWISHGSRVTRLDTRTLRTSETHDLGGFVLALCVGGGVVWAATLDEAPIGAKKSAGETGLLFRLGPEGAVPVARIEGRAAGLAFGAGGVWVAANQLQRVDPARGGVTAAFDERLTAPAVVGEQLWGVRAAYAGEDSEIVRIDPASSEVTVVAAGGTAAALAVQS